MMVEMAFDLNVFLTKKTGYVYRTMLALTNSTLALALGAQYLYPRFAL